MATTAPTFTYRTIAANGQNGPLVAMLSPGEVAVLAANYLTDSANFARLAMADVNAAVMKAELSLPEGQRVQMAIGNLGGYAVQMAGALNQAAASGKVAWGATGEVIQPWPGVTGHQIAWAINDSSITLRWIKGQPWVVAVVLVAVAVIGWELMSLLHQSPYQMASATPGTASNSQSSGTPTTAPGMLAWVGSHIPLIVLGGLGLVATPFVIGQIAKTKESENRLKRAEREAD